MAAIGAAMPAAVGAEDEAEVADEKAAEETEPEPEAPKEEEKKPVSNKPRVVVLTDIGYEPDDEQSLVRLMLYSNQFDIEGLVATTSTWMKENPQPERIRKIVEAYGNVRANLAKHAGGYPTGETLLQAIKTGQPGYGGEAVGPGRSSEGSEHIVRLLRRSDDPRPLWVCIWGGANTLAQALVDLRDAVPEEEFAEMVKTKLIVYAISDQDDSGRWLRTEFPDLPYIVSPTSPLHGREYYLATWTGISGDRYYQNGPAYQFEFVESDWLKKHIREDHGPLGALYPETQFIMEGDSPSFLNLVNNGLGANDIPSYGGWGGRYKLYQSYAETRPIYTNARDTIGLPGGENHTSAQATVWRWRKAFQNDFAARMDWCVTEDYGKANHNPIAAIDEDKGKAVIVKVGAKPGDEVELSAANSSDPDGEDRLSYRWFHYREAGTWRGVEPVDIKDPYASQIRFAIPEASEGDKRAAAPRTLHIILEVKDSGTPNLYSYRRVIYAIAAE